MRLFVTGPTGSGKSTFAAKVARRRGLPLHALDDMHWVRRPTGDCRRSPTDRVALLADVVSAEAWVVEGVQFKWAQSALDRSTLIVVLDLPLWRNLARILRRFAARQCTASKRGTLKALVEELRWCADYARTERQLLFEALATRRIKTLVCRTPAEAQAALAVAMAAAVQVS